MEFKQFLKELNEIGFGLVSANTYHVQAEVVPNGSKPNIVHGHYNCMPGYYIYVTVAGGGDKGICYKRECRVDDSRMMLLQLCDDIRQDIVLKLLSDNNGKLTFSQLADMVLALGKSNYHGNEGSLFAERLKLTLEHLNDTGRIKLISGQDIRSVPSE